MKDPSSAPVAGTHLRDCLSRLCVLLATTFVASCIVLPSWRRLDGARETAAAALALSAEGRHVEATLLAEEIAPGEDRRVAYERAFALGRIHLEHLRSGLAAPDVTSAERVRQLETLAGKAVDRFEEASALAPGEADPLEHLAAIYEGRGDFDRAAARLGQVVVEDKAPLDTARRAVWKATLLSRAGDTHNALVELRALLASDDASLNPLRANVARAIVQTHERVFDQAPLQWAESLSGDCAIFGDSNLPEGVDSVRHAATEGYEVILAGLTRASSRAAGSSDEIASRAHAALHDWLREKTADRAFTPPSLELIPRADAWRPLSADSGNAIAELHLLGGDLPEGFAAFEYWMADLPRRRLLARALRSVAWSRYLSGDAPGAAQLFDRALEERIAPSVDEYEEGGPLEGQSIEVIDLAVDLATLLHQSGRMIEEGDRRGALVLGEVELDLRKGIFAEERPRKVHVEGEAARSIVRFHSVLGLIYADRRAWALEPAGYDAWQTAPVHLREAIRVARDVLGERRPGLARVLAQGLESLARPRHKAGDTEFASRMFQSAFNNYLEASEGYASVDDFDYANRAFTNARELVRSLKTKNLNELRETRARVGLAAGGWLPRGWIEEGWYVRGGVTLMHAEADENQLDFRIEKFGHDVEVDIDDRDSGWNLMVGYQWYAPVSVELGYRVLGTLATELDVTTANPDLPTLLRDSQKLLPLSGEGIEATVRANVFGFGPILVTVAGGFWLWDADVSLTAGGTSVASDEEGLDPHIGLGVVYEITPELRWRLDYGVHFIDQDDLEVLGLGLEYSFALK